MSSQTFSFLYDILILNLLELISSVLFCLDVAIKYIVIDNAVA